MAAGLGNALARRRAAAGLRQEALAAQVGLSRQSLSALESGRSVPSTAVALRLARALGCRVEELFWVADRTAPVDAELAGVLPAGDARVALAWVGERWVAHPLAQAGPGAFTAAADGVVSGRARRGAAGPARVALLGEERVARNTLVCAGCAPAFGILAARTSVDPASRVLWLDRSSAVALDMLARGQVHIAGAHLFDEETEEFNVPFVERRLPGRPMLIFNLARWEAGLVVAKGNPRRIRGVRDLARTDVALVRRQAGSAAQDLLERLLRREDLPAALAARAEVTASGHLEVARLVALGVADTGIALPAVARAHGLDFVPLADERFDLVIDKSMAGDARVARLLETLSGRPFRREMESLGGHIARDAGKLVADTSKS